MYDRNTPKGKLWHQWLESPIREDLTFENFLVERIEQLEATVRSYSQVTLWDPWTVQK